MSGVAADTVQPWGNKSKDEKQHAGYNSREKFKKPRLLIKSLSNWNQLWNCLPWDFVTGKNVPTI